MSATDQNPSPITEAKPMQVGQTPEETQSLIDEISQSGVAQDGADVERQATPGPETGEDASPSQIPVPIVTSP